MKPLDNRNQIADTAATGQEDRKHDSLLPSYFLPDERKVHDLVEFAAGYSKLISYYNSQGRPDGDWAPFFASNPLIALYLIQTYDIRMLRKKYAHLFHELNRSSDPAYREQMLNGIAQNALHGLQGIDALYSALRPFADFHERFGRLIRIRFSKVLQHSMLIERFLLRNSTNKKTLYNYRQEFSREWFEDDTPAELPENTAEAFAQMIRTADEQMYSFFYSLEQLSRDAGNYLEKYTAESGEVKAHIGLLLTFFDLFRYAQDKLNMFTQRHLDYYYSEVLKIEKKPRSYGEAYVVMKLAEAAKMQELKTGLLFPAGTGADGKEIRYALTHPLVVNAAQIDTIIGIECNHPAPDKSPLFDVPFPNKSCFQAGPGSLSEMPKDVNILSQGFGFALCAKLLAQPEGDRRFTFRFTFAFESFRNFMTACRAELERRRPRESAYDAARTDEEKINALLTEAFVISGSTPDGWFEIPAGKMDFVLEDEHDCVLKATLLLESTDPAITATPDAGFIRAFAEQLPVFRFLLRNDASPVYTVLRHLVVTKTAISVSVIGARNLNMRNDFGPLVPGAPFEMFGPLPQPGASFYLGHPALLSPVSDLCITFEWSGLPNINGGFATHYKGYDYVKDNSTFKSLVSCLRGNRWEPVEMRQLITLFQDAPEDKHSAGVVSPITRLNNFNLEGFGLLKKAIPMQAAGPFPGTDTNGFLRFEFCYPPNGFGHADYPALINKATQEMAMKKRKKETVPLPAEPYTPTLKNVLLDFTTEEEFIFGENGYLFYQLYPYGKECCDSPEHHEKKRLLPFFPDGSTLLIGFSRLEDKSTLSLLTKINDAASAMTETAPEIEWSMLEENDWEPLAPETFISDETGRMKRTGITRFAFGDISNGDSPLYDPSLAWMRIESKNGVPFLPMIERIYTQAGMVRLHSGEPIEESLAPFTIKSFLYNNASIESVIQPYASSGDRPAEKDEDWYRRISERLRHRGRALTSWDYEHLVLEQFPEVQMVKCISHIDGENLKAPGNILLAVLPATVSSGDMSRSGLFTIEKLEEISSWLETITPGDVKVNAMNPQYEKVRVKLRIKFAEGYDELFYKRQINHDITEFLNPWKDGNGSQVRFGVSMSGFTILNFIEKLYYVDFVTNFTVFHVVKGKVVNLGSMKNGSADIVPSTPVSILVPHDDHIINMYDETGSDSGGINEMIVETDFMMNADLQQETGQGINFGKVGKDLFIDGKETEQKVQLKSVKLKMKTPN